MTRTSKTAAVFKVVWSLFSGSNRSPRSQPFRPAINAAKASPHVPPFNTEQEIAKGVFELTRDRGIIEGNGGRFAVPYWNRSEAYDPWEIFYCAIQFIDDHDAPIPTTVIPPEQHVEEYLRRILDSDEKLMVSDQLRILLDITGNDIVGAANVGFLTSRLLSRASDFRPYPGIHAHLKEEDISRWNRRMTQFTSDVDRNTSDGPGDTYYFWTQCFCAMYYRSQSGINSRIADFLFAYGAPIMRFVRGVIARNPTLPHEHAAHIGRRIGLAIAKRLTRQSRGQEAFGD